MAGTANVERFDDRIAGTCDLAAGRPCVFRFPVVPTVAGHLLWPPATAAPMYVAGLEGGTEGGFVDVAAAAAGDVPSTVTCFTSPAPPPELEDEDPFWPFCRALREAWELDPPDETRSQAGFEVQMADLPRVGEDERWRWLVDLTELERDLELPEAAGESAATAWRLLARDRVHALLRDATLAAFATLPAAADETPPEQWSTLAKAVAAWPHGPERQAMFARLLARATSDESRLWLIGELEQPAAAPALRAGLGACLSSGDARLRRAAFAALPPEDQAALPPVLVIAAQQGVFADGVIRMLAGSAAGRAELRLRLSDPDFVLPQYEPLVAELPAELWREVPLAVFGSLVATEGGFEDDPTATAALAARVAATGASDAELLQAMAATVVPSWRAVLASALRQRGATASPQATRADDTLWPLWRRALALADDDVAGALRLLDEATALGTGRLDVEADLLRAFALPPFVASGTPDQLYAARASMREDTWQSAWRRLDGEARVALLEHFQQRIGTTFAPATAAEAEAVWRFLRRGGEVESAVETLCGSAAGIACLRRHLAAGEGGDAAVAMREQFAKELALDADTLQPAAGREWQALVARLRRVGFAEPWSAEARARLDRLRAQCGLGDAAGR